MKAALLALGLAFSVPAQAQQAFSTDRTFVSAHFSGWAFGKEVQSVRVHAGVRKSLSPGQKGFWEDVHDLELEKKADHFFGKLTLLEHHQSGDPYWISPVIQYWVTFADGSTWISDEVEIPLEERQRMYEGCVGPESDCLKPEIIERMNREHEERSDTDHTYGKLLSTYHG